MALVDFSLGDVGNLFRGLREAITGESITDPNLKLELLSKLQEAESQMLSAQASTIVAEASSEHWITSTWRPIGMLVFITIVANNYIIAPYASLFGVDFPKLDLPPDMWNLLSLGFSGYVVGRSAEKVVKIYKSGTK